MDLEARAHSEHPDELRLWLRLLTCTQLIEKQVRNELREQFATTLPRFDLMSQLERAPEGLKMNELSRRMMVTGGNVTGITDQLVTEGLVERVDVAGDRRAWRVRTPAHSTDALMPHSHDQGAPARQPTPYADLNAVLAHLVEGARGLLGEAHHQHGADRPDERAGEQEEKVRVVDEHQAQ